MLKHKIKKEEGSGLVLTLMVLLVLSVLGASVATVTMGSNRLGHATQDSNSAYYIAEAGANMAYEEIRQGVVEAYANNNELGVEAAIDLVPEKYDEFETQSGHQPEANISISNPVINGNQKSYTIKSIGHIGSTKRTVSKIFIITWVKDDSSGSNGGFLNPGNGGTILANGSINFTAGTINGDVYMDTSQQGKITIDNTVNPPNGIITIHSDKSKVFNAIPGGGIDEKLKVFTNITRTETIKYDWESHSNSIPIITELYTVNNAIHKEFVSSTLLKYKGINITNYLLDKEITKGSNTYKVQRNESLYIDNYLIKDANYSLQEHTDTYIKNIKIDGGQTLKINTNGNNVIYMIDNLNFSGSAIEILGGGSVTFYVKNSMTFNSSGVINKTGNQDAFNLYYSGSNVADFSNLSELNGSVYVESAGAKLTGVKISGPVFIGGNKTVNYTGGSTGSFYAPNANLNLSSGIVNGSLISKKILMGGSTIVNGDVNAYEFDMISGSLINGSVTAYDLSMDGAGTINGGVSAKAINMPSGAKINGFVVSEEVYLTGGAKIIGAVGANTVKLDSGGHIEGNVITNQLIMKDGGPTITYKEVDFSTYPFDIEGIGSSNGSSLEDLIASSPAIEN